MLVLTRKKGQKLIIGDNIEIVVLENESVELSHGEDTIKLIGLNDNSLTDDTLNKLIDNNILL